MTCAERLEAALRELRANANPKDLEGMARFGIKTDRALGVKVPTQRKIARAYRNDHELALALWDTQIHEARMMASMVDDPAQVTPGQMDRWAQDFDSWDICDQCCGNLFDRTPHAYAKVVEWSDRPEEFVKRSAFALIAGLTVHDKAAEDEVFIAWFDLMEREAWDERNFVWKAINWALRNTGKRNAVLNAASLQCARRILDQETRSARWIARDAIRELESEAVRRRLGL